MGHVAIMKKSWGLLPKILSGEKTIESRWYLVRATPWGRVQAGDTVYFKNSGETVTVRAKVAKVLSFADLTPVRVNDILRRYGEEDGIKPEEFSKFYQLFKDKKYCLLIFLKDAQRIKPFQIDKRGFGAMAAWLCVGDINKIKLSVR